MERPSRGSDGRGCGSPEASMVVSLSLLPPPPITSLVTEAAPASTRMPTVPLHSPPGAHVPPVRMPARGAIALPPRLPAAVALPVRLPFAAGELTLRPGRVAGLAQFRSRGRSGRECLGRILGLGHRRQGDE